MRTLRFFCLFMLVACCFGSPITVPNSGQGAAWFTGYVDTVPSGGGFDYLLGWSFEVRIDYRLSGWDGVTPLVILYGLGGSPVCDTFGVHTNCVADFSGPIGSGPDGVGISIANGQLTSIFDFDGEHAVNWSSATPDRWSGHWTVFTTPSIFISGNISGPVTDVEMAATPEPSAAATMVLGLGALLCIWQLRNAHRRPRAS